MGVVCHYGLADFQSIAAGAAVLASGGVGGSYHDACSILQELANQGWGGTVTVQDYGQMVSVIAVKTAPQLYNTPGVVASFAALLRNMGYSGAMPTA